MDLHCQVKCQEGQEQLTADVSLEVDEHLLSGQMIGCSEVEVGQR